ncbi:hypothetical protein PHYBOEH_007604 [Phytophthora boehmeriae]|uniref:Uncharacterized protein n=1 Tax=Phytophthora boehmeriae TaxID=109152 RepID=A0A8T1X6D4_9STRA|nr:hypothetical protein PHYBOEH_007604 [Phytophthora boehmeriae]
MPAARQQRDPWEFKPREDLSTSMAVFAGTSRSANASFSYSSHESGGSSATYEFRSQRSDEPVADDFTEHSSSLQRQPVTPITTESVRLGDKRLHELGAAAASSVNWPELEMELAAASLSASHKSVWKRKKMSKSYSNDTMKLFTRNTIADHRHRTRWGPKGFAVLADGILPCSAQELRLVFRVHSTDIFRDVMRSVYRREFVEGELLRTIKIQQGDVNPARASDTTELSVKTATFEGSSVFSKNEACHLGRNNKFRTSSSATHSKKTQAAVPHASCFMVNTCHPTVLTLSNAPATSDD